MEDFIKISFDSNNENSPMTMNLRSENNYSPENERSIEIEMIEDLIDSKENPEGNKSRLELDKLSEKNVGIIN